MGNMSYCRFQNTVIDLRDCYDHMDELPEADADGISDNDAREIRCRKSLIKLCVEIALNHGHEVGQDVDLIRAETQVA